MKSEIVEIAADEIGRVDFGILLDLTGNHGGIVGFSVS